MEIKYSDVPSHEARPLARFWHYCQDDAYRLIVLSPDQKVEIDTGRLPTEEGYTHDIEIIEHRGSDLLLTAMSFSRDCDGPLDTERVCVVTLDRLAVFQGPDGAPLTPDWVKSSSSQRDRFAEAMGY